MVRHVHKETGLAKCDYVCIIKNVCFETLIELYVSVCNTFESIADSFTRTAGVSSDVCDFEL